jgi:hypothetical protein
VVGAAARRWWWRRLAALALLLRRALPRPARAHRGVIRRRIRVRVGHQLVLCLGLGFLFLFLFFFFFLFLLLRLGLRLAATFTTVTFFRLARFAAMVTVTFHSWLGILLFLRLGLAMSMLPLAVAGRFAWLGCRWRRPDLGDDDLLDELAGLGPDLLTELFGVEFPAHNYLLVLVVELYLLDAKLLCIVKNRELTWHACIDQNSALTTVSL